MRMPKHGIKDLLFDKLNSRNFANIVVVQVEEMSINEVLRSVIMNS